MTLNERIGETARERVISAVIIGLMVYILVGEYTEWVLWAKAMLAFGVGGLLYSVSKPDPVS